MPAPNVQSSTKTETSAQTKVESAVNLLKADHRKVESLFAQCEKAEGAEQKAQLAKQICKELIIHTRLEEEIFYPACREKNVEHEMLDEAQVEHDSAKILIGELLSQSPDDEFYGAKVTVLSEYIKHHVGEEEKARNGIFAAAQKAGVDMNALGQRIQARKQELMAQIDENRLEPPQPRSLHPSTRQSRSSQENDQMPRQSFERERDEYGRFMSDDDDDRRGGRRGGSSFRERDEQGRFMSDDDDYRSSRSSRGRNGDYDDDRQSSRGGRGQGGWFGDPEGHSEAARRGRSGGSRYEDDDDYRSSRSGYSSRGMQGGRSSSRYEEDDDDRRSSRGGRSQGGWFGDPEGHSEASERGWESRGSSRGGRSSSRYEDDDDRRSSRGGRGEGQGGWFGDPEGHSEAAQRGWEGRGSSRGGRQSSGRDDDDDDRRSSRGRGGQSQGGWFGDSRGHAEAARRGWRNRD